MIDIIARFADSLPGGTHRGVMFHDIPNHPGPFDLSEPEQFAAAARFLAEVARERGFVLTVEQRQLMPAMGAHIDVVNVHPARVDGAYAASPATSLRFDE